MAWFLLDAALAADVRTGEVEVVPPPTDQPFVLASPPGFDALHYDLDGAVLALVQAPSDTNATRVATVVAALADAAPTGRYPELAELELRAALTLAKAERKAKEPRPFQTARLAVADAFPSEAGPVASALRRAPAAALAALPTNTPIGEVVQRLASAAVPVNPRLEALASLPADSALRGVQPAVVRILAPGGAGTGVNLRDDGLVLTAAHVVSGVGAVVRVEFPDGSPFAATCVAWDEHRDLALLDFEGLALPFARLADSAPSVGSSIVVIGNPGGETMAPFQVSSGRIVAIDDARDGTGLRGAVTHSAWTEWGHSGAPLFDLSGHIVGLHNSYDLRDASRHAVSWEAIRAVTDPG